MKNNHHWDDGSYEAFEANFKKKWGKLFRIISLGWYEM